MYSILFASAIFEKIVKLVSFLLILLLVKIDVLLAKIQSCIAVLIEFFRKTAKNNMKSGLYGLKIRTCLDF